MGELILRLWALLNRAIGDKLQCVFVNHGLLRQNEQQIVAGLFKSMGIEVIYVDEEKRFLEKLKEYTIEEADHYRRRIFKFVCRGSKEKWPLSVACTGNSLSGCN